MGCGPSVQAAPSSAKSPVHDEPPTPLPVAQPSGGRRLSTKSKPFWQLEQERKAKRQDADAVSDGTGSPSSGSVSDNSHSGRQSPDLQVGIESKHGGAAGRLCTALSSCVTASGSSEVSTSQPIVDPAPAAPADPIDRTLASDVNPVAAEGGEPAAAFCSIGGGCGCGEEATEAPIDPLEWIAKLEDAAARETELEWHAKLSEGQFRVLRMKGTEEIHTGALNDHFAKSGAYHCAACHTPLYDAPHKFKSGHGWPAFSDNLPGALTRTEHGRNKKIEICCSGCGGHVGHIFKSKRYPAPTHERHCVNSMSLEFVPPPSPEGTASGTA